MNSGTQFENDVREPLVVPGLVSVLVLSLNRKEETLACLEAIERQTYADREIVLVENGSTDGSQEALEVWRDRVNLIQMPRNHGDWEGRDIGLVECRGEFVIIIDNDAIVPDDCIEHLLAALKRDESLGAVQPKIVDPASGVPYDPGFGREAADIRFHKAVFHGCVTMFRSKALRGAGGFPHWLLGGAEDFISLRMHDLGYSILYEPAVEIRHLMSPKERVPHFRLQQQSAYKMRAKVIVAPTVGRAIYEFMRGTASYCYHALRLRLWPHLPRGFWKHVECGVGGMAERRPISRAAFGKYHDQKARIHRVEGGAKSMPLEKSRGRTQEGGSRMGRG